MVSNPNRVIGLTPTTACKPEYHRDISSVLCANPPFALGSCRRPVKSRMGDSMPKPYRQQLPQRATHGFRSSIRPHILAVIITISVPLPSRPPPTNPPPPSHNNLLSALPYTILRTVQHGPRLHTNSQAWLTNQPLPPRTPHPYTVRSWVGEESLGTGQAPCMSRKSLDIALQMLGRSVAPAAPASHALRKVLIRKCNMLLTKLWKRCSCDPYMLRRF